MYAVKGSRSVATFGMMMAVLGIAMIFSGCPSPNEPAIVPPVPVFANPSVPPSVEEHGFYGDVDPNIDAIWIEWNADPTRTTTGYRIYRSTSQKVGDDGILLNDSLITQFESDNQSASPLQKSYRDTLHILPGETYYYQMQAFNRSSQNVLTFSAPTSVSSATSFLYAPRLKPITPQGETTLPADGGLTFVWGDPEDGGDYQLIVERVTNIETVVYSSPKFEDFNNTPALRYPGPDSATALVPGADYRWRVKKIVPFGGSSSPWYSFFIKQ